MQYGWFFIRTQFLREQSKKIGILSSMERKSVVPAIEIDTEYSKIRRNDFPEYFIFGTGTSAYQTEGAASQEGRGPSVWDDFCLKTPGKITDGSNGNVAIDMYNKFEEDFKMMKSMGLDAYRFSISWSRITPGGKVSLGINNKGIEFYNKIIDCLLAHGIEPYVTLFHWDLPHSLELEYGGFLSKNVVHDFKEFAELCFWNFGDRVKKWVTLNEPWAYAVHGYVDGFFPPGEGGAASSSSTVGSTGKAGKNYIAYKCFDEFTCAKPKASLKDNNNNTDGENTDTNHVKAKPEQNPAKDVYTVARNLLLAHAAAVESYRTKFQEKQKGQLGITINSYWYEPYTDTTKDQEAARRALDFMLGWFLEPVLIGQYPQNMKNFVPEANLAPFTSRESKLLKGSIDFLGLNYYTANYAANDPHASNFGGDGYYKDKQVAFYTERDGKPIGPPTGSSWQFIVPSGIYKLLKHVNATYNNSMYNLPPIYITENGVGETLDPKLTAREACKDKIRVKFFRAHLGNILKAMNEENVDLRGYFLWSWCDNFEWIFGYTVRFGIIYIDYMNYLNRHPKASALWITKFLAKP